MLSVVALGRAAEDWKKEDLVITGLLNFGVPFLVQLGFGADLGPAAKRALIAGAALSGTEAALYFGKDWITNPTLSASLSLASPLIGAGLYAGGQSFLDGFGSQGMMKDFTFAAASGYISYGMGTSVSALVDTFMAKRDSGASVGKAAANALEKAARLGKVGEVEPRSFPKGSGLKPMLDAEHAVRVAPTTART